MKYTDPSEEKLKWWGKALAYMTGVIPPCTIETAGSTFVTVAAFAPTGGAIMSWTAGFFDEVFNGNFGDALAEGDRRAQNSWKLTKGFFKSDPNQSKGQILKRFTNGSLQSSLGYFFAQRQNFFRRVDVEYFHGATVTIIQGHKGPRASCIGNYITGR